MQQHYTELYNTAIQKIRADNCETDNWMDNPHDKRMGITLLYRPNENVKRHIQSFLKALKAITPPQYFYPSSDIHITVLSLISCYQGFDINQINVNEYIAVIKKSLVECSPFYIHFKGITASPSCVMIQGFPQDDTLNIIRQNLRVHFKNTTLQQSIDARYSIQIAHTTVLRFKEQLHDKNLFINTLDAYRSFDFGISKVSKLELVYNDWYQRKNYVKKLSSFNLIQI